MNKAFIFDMDGVIVDSEIVWQKRDKEFFTSLLGEKGYKKISNLLLGSTADVIYTKAVTFGLKIKKEEFMQKYDKLAISVYKEANITKGIETLIEYLKKNNYKLGLLTASRQLWIEQVLPKIKNRNVFELIISLSERTDLRPKPFADGYNEIMKKFKSNSKRTIILEDSQKGVDAAKASGALTICLTENLVGEKPKDADYYMNNIQEVITFIKKYE